MTGFHIMVAYGLSVVFHVVDHTCRKVLLCGVHVVAVITGGLPLKDVAIVEQQQTVAVILTQGVNVSVDPCQ